ncbi:hypothetical protein BH20ACT2_BH20ACT2_00440 [soil metagenome]
MRADPALLARSLEARSSLEALSDPALPALPDLLVDHHELLCVAAAASGAELIEARPRQVTWRPGSSLTVRYDAELSRDGARCDESFVAATGAKLPAGCLVLDDGESRVGVWQALADPWLPGLAAMFDPDRLRRLLDDLGVAPGEPTARLRAHRPGRRAVVEVTTPSARLFVKVVAPRKAEALHHRHVMLADHLPVPRSLGWSPEHGVVVLQAVPGVPLRDVVGLHPDGGARQAHPDAAALLALLDAIPLLDPDRAVVGWRSEEFAELVALTCPPLRPRVEGLAGALDQIEATLDEPLVPVHADFHDGQLLTDGSRITGLVDLDTVGPGHRLDDLATLIGHLATLALMVPRRGAIEAYAARLLAAFDRVADPAMLRASVAAKVLGLATGPFRVLEDRWPANTEQRVHLAERWLDSAHQVSENSLTSGSGSSHLAPPSSH